MSITHSTYTRNVLANSLVGLIDIGSGPNGVLIISQVTPVPIDIVVINFSAKAFHAFGVASGGTSIANALPLEGQVTVLGTTTAQAFFIKDCNGDLILQGTVSDFSGTGDIKLLSTTLNYGDYVRLTSLSYTASL